MNGLRRVGVPHSLRLLRGYVRKHWLGDLPPRIAFWRNFALLAAFLEACQLGLLYSPWYSRATLHASQMLSLLVIMQLVILPWQVVGSFRSARKTKTPTPLWISPWLIRAAALLIAAAVIGHLVARQKFFRETALIAIHHDPVGSFAIIDHPQLRAIEISGTLAFGVAEEFERHLAVQQITKYVWLNSNGGRVAAGRQLARIIERHRLATYTDRGCASSCIIAYLGGTERILHPRARLGFHGYRSTVDQPITALVDQLADQELFIRKGISENFIKQAFSTVPPNLWIPTPAKLEKEHIISAQNDRIFDRPPGPSFVPSPTGQIEDNPYFQIIRRYDRQQTMVVQDTLDQLFSQDTYKGVVHDQLLALLNKIFRSQFSHASDDTAVKYGRQLLNNLKIWRASDPVKCAGAISNGGMTTESGISADGKDNQSHEQAALDVLVSSYVSPHPSPQAEEILPMLQSLRREMIDLFGDDAQLLGSGPVMGKELRYCSVLISLYESILRLPVNKAGGVLRYLFSHPAGTTDS